MKKKNILITGGLGKLGVKFIRRLKLTSDTGSITVIDNLKNSSIKTAVDVETMEVNVFLEDVRRRKKICKDFDTIFHLAAHIDIKDSYSDPLSDASNNILGTVAIIKNYPARKFVYFSSEDIYGNLRYADEESRPDPETPYGFSKLGGEVYARMLCKNYLILRIAEEIEGVDNFIETVVSLVERDIKGTVNIGDSKKINCQKLKDLMPFRKYD